MMRTIAKTKPLSVEAIQVADNKDDVEDFLRGHAIKYTMQWDSTDIQTVNESRPRRILTTCTIQVWDGSNFYEIDFGDWIFITPENKVFVWDNKAFTEFFEEE